MKTKWMMIIGLFALGLLVGQEARAFYNPSSGRWLSRDPIEEVGGRNLYCFVENEAVLRSDRLGLACANPCAEAVRLRMDGGDIGGAVCCGGKRWSCAWKPGGITDASDFRARVVIARCILAHENDHEKWDSVSCAKCPDLRRTKFKNFPEQKQGECEAWKVSSACLWSAISDGGCGGETQCIIQVAREARAEEEQAKDWCR